MTQPALVSDRQSWEDLLGGLRETVLAVAGLYDAITGRINQKDHDMTDPDLEAELEDERRRRLDYETDFDLDGDYDPTPADDLDAHGGDDGGPDLEEE
ncbi:hypothetical protein [Planosporangium mesophilum]|uniref:Uncharacterized protein n=1 Tax=Planosporangium mesophilum TaxID=689768 RepID=A0A8J3TC16_9ACTN|nr:hypothetical protein [Planosporangium mesophilum]NJC83153.1 hypothetical protein [Planosporangium mesophilum]GII22571.1 hypothetical protein Pme01_21680 [Planosporangium mesophilum]